MHKPLVSVIIPLYNSKTFIAETIASVQRQSWPNIELIIVDDGSTDGSLALVKGFEAANVKIFHQQNMGASAARNKGLQEANGQYVQFLDADDLLSPDKLKEQVSILMDAPDYVSAGPTIHFTDGTNPYGQAPRLDWFKDGVEDTSDFFVKLYGGALIGPEYGGMVALHSWLIPMKTISKAGRWNEALSLDDDGEFMCRVVLASKGIIYAPGALNYYRKHLGNANISSSTSYRAHFSLLTSVKLKMGYLLEKRDDQLARSALCRIFREIAVSFYPEYPLLTDEAEKIARELDPTQETAPYNGFPSKYISRVFGWKTMKRLTRFKQKWMQRRKSLSPGTILKET